MPQTDAIPAVDAGPEGQTPRRGTVFVIQGDDTGKFKRAQRFGELVYLMLRDVFPDNADEHIEKMRHVMSAKLKDFNPSRDYVLLTGDPLAIAMSVLVLSQWTLEIPCLKWDKLEQDYYAVTVNI
jgi:hypothetical protein